MSKRKLLSKQIMNTQQGERGRNVYSVLVKLIDLMSLVDHNLTSRTISSPIDVKSPSYFPSNQGYPCVAKES